MTEPKLAVKTALGRGYRHPVTGEVVPSITTVVDQVAKPGVVNGAAKVAAWYADENWAELSALRPGQRRYRIATEHTRQWGRKAALGTAVHEVCEAWATGQRFPRSEQYDGYLDQLAEFLFDTRPVFLETEVTVWSSTYSYAGTADAFVRIGGELLCLDWKTGASLHAEMALQLAALGNAECIIRPDGSTEPLPAFDALAVVHLRPDSWTFARVCREKECFAAFLAARELARWQEQVAEHALKVA